MKTTLAGLCVRLSSVALGLALAGAPAAFAQPATGRINTADYFATKDYSQTVTFPNGVTMTQVTYSALNGYRPLMMDVYKPPGNGVHPGLMFIHGGNWRFGTLRNNTPYGDFPGLLAQIAARGYVVTSVQYRLSEEAKFPAQLMDVKTALRFMRSNAGAYGLDPTRIATWGFSAGGYLAVMAGLVCGVPALTPPAPDNSTAPVPSDCAQAAVNWSGLLVLDRMFSDQDKPDPAVTPSGQLLGCEPKTCPPELLRLANPMNYISEKSPPILSQHGDADAQIPTKQPLGLTDALRAKGVPAEFVVYRNSGHGFTNTDRTPGASRADPANNQASVDKMMEFLAKTFPQRN
jgi:acetyl esterase/lipase